MRRALLLLCCVAAGGAIGLAGWLFTGTQHWFLAVPAVIAAAWLAVADTRRCVQEPKSEAGSERSAA
jgi:uncharacterized membrane protein